MECVCQKFAVKCVFDNKAFVFELAFTTVPEHTTVRRPCRHVSATTAVHHPGLLPSIRILQTVATSTTRPRHVLFICPSPKLVDCAHNNAGRSPIRLASPIAKGATNNEQRTTNNEQTTNDEVVVVTSSAEVTTLFCVDSPSPRHFSKISDFTGNLWELPTTE